MTPIPTPERGGMGHPLTWSGQGWRRATRPCFAAGRCESVAATANCVCVRQLGTSRASDTDRMAEVPTTFDALSVMIYGGLGRYSRETSLVFSAAVEEWRRELQSGVNKPDIDIYSIDVNL